MRFRPCIDLHAGVVKQIVGSTIKDDIRTLGGSAPVENFVSEKPAAWYAELYRERKLPGGHVICLGPGNEEAALSALRAYPGGLQVGGGVTPQNAGRYLDAGASHVIVTSYVFSGGSLDEGRLRELVAAVGKERLVLDLSCRGRVAEGGDVEYYVVTDRWQHFTDLRVDGTTLRTLAASCDEFLVHGVDVEGKRQGLEERLVALLGEHSPIPVTYAGGARGMADLELVRRVGQGKVDLTIGSALDIFGGDVPLDDVIEYCK